MSVHDSSQPPRDSGRSVLFVVATVACIAFVLGGYTVLTDWLVGAAGESPPPSRRRSEEERAPAGSLRRTEQSVQRQIDAFVEKHGRNPDDLHEVKKGLVARLDQSLPKFVDVEYDPGTGRVRVFEIDPFEPGPTEHSVFGLATFGLDPDRRAQFFVSFLRGDLEHYRERHGRFPEDIRDCVPRRGRGFRLPLGYRVEYDAATGHVDAVPD